MIPPRLGRVRPKVVTTQISPNRYTPRGDRILLVVLHDTEGHNRPGISDLTGLGALFAEPSLDASCHVGVDAEGQSGRYVQDEDAAYQCCAYNRYAVGIEQIGFASQTHWPEAQVREAARWVARWSFRHGVPIRKAWTVRGRVIRSGVTTHAKLGAVGCGHHDPGLHYPMEKLLDHARYFLRELKAEA